MKISLSIAMICLAASLSACGGGSSAPSTPPPPPVVVNVAPLANPGANQNIVSSTLVTLDASASSDANSDPLTYLWTLTSKPNGSVAALSSATAVKPTFTADLAGTYVATLVVNDGKLNSVTATVAVVATVANAAPVANAGNAQNVTTAKPVLLDGSLSSDANGDTLSYLWTLKEKPANSTAVVANATVVNPTFVPDLPGTYKVSLVVNDGKVSSAETIVEIKATAVLVNAAPVADAGAAQSVLAFSTVKLDGGASSDANGDVLTYSWTMTSKPAISAAVLANATSKVPTFMSDKAGTYVVTLVVNDGKLDSAASTVTITVTAAADNAAPVANAGPSKKVSAGDIVPLNGLASTDANGDQLTYAWKFTSIPAGSDAVIAGANLATPNFVADKPGAYVVTLVVTDAALSSTPATVIVSASAKLTDTGIAANQCHDSPATSLVSCTSSSAIAYYDQQDGMLGADVTTPDPSNGKLGFNYTKLDASGKALASSASTWSCVKDNLTGLTWEIKTVDRGLRDQNKIYTNFADGRPDDASAFAKEVNATGLCGHSDWRLPTAFELQSIVDYGSVTGPTVDADWFINTVSTKYWSSTRLIHVPDKTPPNNAWFVDFSNGVVSPLAAAESSLTVRLVR